MTAKNKSQMRFEQLNLLVDEITKTLPTPGHVAVLLVCFRHGYAGGMFSVSTKRIAESVALKPRRVQVILDDLEQWGVIQFAKEHKGPLPRRYRITGKAANREVPTTAKATHSPGLNGAAHDTINRQLHQRSPQLNGAVQCA